MGSKRDNLQRSATSLLDLPADLIELIHWHCQLSSTGALRLCSRATNETVKRHCWSSDDWLVRRVPLQFLLQKAGASDAVCLRRLAAHPFDAHTKVDAAAYDGIGRCTMLHLSLEARGESEALLLAMLKAHPSAAHERDADYGMLPIEVAAEQGTPLPILHALLEVHRSAGGVPPNHGGVHGGVCAPHPNALHLAVINGASARAVGALLRVSPVLARAWAAEDVFRDDWCEHTPLHFAAIYGSHAGARAARVVHALHLAHPRAAATREGRHGMLPLHLAALNAAPVEAIAAIAHAFPQALYVKDDLGRTPLECVRAGIAGGVLGGESEGIGYTYMEYCGLNERTRARLAYRQTKQHAAAVIACVEGLYRKAYGSSSPELASAHDDEGSSSSAALSASEDEQREPLTWRYHMEEERYGQVLEEPPAGRGGSDASQAVVGSSD